MAALLSADAVVVGPGSLYTSIVPTLMVQGIAGTLYIEADFACMPALTPHKIRHDPESLAAAIMSVVQAGRAVRA